MEPSRGDGQQAINVTGAVSLSSGSSNFLFLPTDHDGQYVGMSTQFLKLVNAREGHHHSPLELERSVLTAQRSILLLEVSETAQRADFGV